MTSNIIKFVNANKIIEICNPDPNETILNYIRTKLTTHCLDTFSGKPAKGVKVEIYSISSKKGKLNSIILNSDGRSDKPLLEGADFKEGQYELVFFYWGVF